jgi:hypothetical protein
MISASSSAQAYEYDVFISYNHKDQDDALALEEALSGFGLRVFIDREIRAGDAVPTVLARNIVRSKSVVIVFGSFGFTEYQADELRHALHHEGGLAGTAERRRVIPLILPRGPAPNGLPEEVRPLSRMSFDAGIDDRQRLSDLYYSIEGKRPPKPQAEFRSAQADASESRGTFTPAGDALAALRDSAESSGITFFLGERAAHHEGARFPNSYEMAHEIYSDPSVSLIDSEYEELLPSFDVAGTCYATRRTPTGLDTRLSKMYAGKLTYPPPVLDKLAEVIGQLRSRVAARAPWDAGVTLPQLIVTTNHDVCLERALLRAGISFARFVQLRAPSNDQAYLQTNIYRVQLEGRTLLSLEELQVKKRRPVETTDLSKLDEFIKLQRRQRWKLTAPERSVDVDDENEVLSFGDMPDVLVYKYHGSVDVPRSCTVSTDQYLEFVKYGRVPKRIQTVISSSTSLVFLGYLLLDPPFRHLHQTLLHRSGEVSVEEQNRWLIVSPTPAQSTRPAYNRLEALNWKMTAESPAKGGSFVVRADTLSFLDDLLDQIHTLEGVEA